jgi:DNA polymerase
MTGSASLAKCAEFFQLPPKGTEVVNAKGKRRYDFTDEEYEAYAEYCTHDCTLTWALFRIMLDMMPKSELALIDMTIRMYTEPRLQIDPQRCENAIRKEAKRTAAALQKVGHTAQELRSDFTFAKILEKYIGAPPKKVTAKGNTGYAFAKTDASFQRLLKHKNPKVQELCEARLRVKSSIDRTRLESFANIALWTGGALPVPLAYYGAHTGRFSGDQGINLQNLPRGSELRKAIHAPDGFHIVAADLAQIEARVNAHLSGETDLLHAFAKGDDIYLDFASSLWNKKLTKDDNPDERFIGKTCILGLGYQMGKDRLYSTLENTENPISMEFAEHCVKTYRARYPNIASNWRFAESVLDAMMTSTPLKWGPMTTQYQKLLLPNGLALNYFKLRKRADKSGTQIMYTDMSRKGYVASDIYVYGGKLVENAVQALSRIILTDAMLKLWGKHKIVLQVHDEIVFVIHDKYLEQALVDIEKAMTTPPKWMPDLPLAVEIHYGKTYKDCK